MNAIKGGVRTQLRIAAERLRMPGVGELPAGPRTADELDKARGLIATLIDKAETAAKLLSNFLEAGVVSEGYRPHLNELNAALTDMGEDDGSAGVAAPAAQPALALTQPGDRELYIRELVAAASAGTPQDGDRAVSPGLWFGPDRAERLRNALAGLASFDHANAPKAAA